MARMAASRMVSCNRYSGSRRPGLSVRMNCASSRVRRPTTGTRVDCGFAATIARCSPTSALSRVDLPTFGRPARATVPQRGMPANYSRRGKHEARRGNLGGLQQRSWRRPTLPPPLRGSTIGADGLNDRVRDGNGCGPVALVASKKINEWGEGVWEAHELNCGEIKPHGQLVRLG